MELLELITTFSRIIDSIRTILEKEQVTYERIFKNAFLRLFSRQILTMCEIYTLINNGYPNGAVALSRNVYENTIIIDILVKYRTDLALLERFFDSEEYSHLMICKRILESTKAPQSPEKNLQEFFDSFSQRYSSFLDKKHKLSDYWWFKKGASFKDLCDESNFFRSYTYHIASKTLHADWYSCTHCIGGKKEILIGETSEGLDLAMFFALINFIPALDHACNLINPEFKKPLQEAKQLILALRE